MSRPIDWFDFASGELRIKTAEIALLGPSAIDVSQTMAPDAKQDQREREAARQWRHKIYPTPCPNRDYTHYDEPIRTVADRLPIWC